MYFELDCAVRDTHPGLHVSLHDYECHTTHQSSLANGDGLL